jgi:hypothetical protein
MLQYFAGCSPLARPHRRPSQNPPCLQYSGLVIFFYFYVHDGSPNNEVRALADLCAHFPPPRLLVADTDETETGACFFHPFAYRLFARALFRYKALSGELKAVARL